MLGVSTPLLRGPWRAGGLRRVIGRQGNARTRCRRQEGVRAFKTFAPFRGFDGADTEDEGDLLLDMLLRYPARYGTVAVVLGYLLGVPAFGNLHWSEADAWLGLQCAAPILLLDLPLMDFWPGAGLKHEEEEEDDEGGGPTDELALAAQTAAALQSATEATAALQGATAAALAAAAARGGKPALDAALLGLGEGELPGAKAAAGGEEQGEGGQWEEDTLESDELGSKALLYGLEEEEEVPHPLLEALRCLREEHTLQCASLALSWPADLGLSLVHHLGEEMLFRAVLLGGLAKLSAVAMYAFGAEELGLGLGLGLDPMGDLLLGPGSALGGAFALRSGGWDWGQPLEVPQVAALMAGAGAVLLAAGAAFWREYRAVRVFKGLEAQGFTLDAAVGLGEELGDEGLEALLEEERALEREERRLAQEKAALRAKMQRKMEEVRQLQAALREGGEGAAGGGGDSNVAALDQVQRELAALIEAAGEEEAEEAQWQEHRKWLVNYMQQERGWAGAIQAVREGASTACLAAAFFLTGNLLAPYVAAVVSDLSWTAYQRSRRDQALESVELWDQLLEQSSLAEEEERKEKLARLGLGPPPSSTRGSRDED